MTSYQSEEHNKQDKYKTNGNIQPSPTQLYTLLEMLILLYDTEIQISSTQTFIPFVLQSSVVH